MQYPSTLKIGAHEVRLVFASFWKDSEDAYAEWTKEENTIYVRTGLTDTQVFSAILHEAMHVMNATLDHTLLDSLSEQIAQFLLANNLAK